MHLATVEVHRWAADVKRPLQQGVGIEEALHDLAHVVGQRRQVGLGDAAAEPAIGLDQSADPVLFGLGQADPEVEVERRGDLVGEELPEALARDPTNDLPDEPPVGEGVVAVGRSRVPVGLLGGQRLNDRVPGEHLLRAQMGVDGGQTGLVAEQPAHGDVALALGPEVGPVLDDRRVEVELAALGKEVGAHCGGALRRGEHELKGVLVPGSVRLVVGDTAPEVDDLLAAHVQADGGTDITVGVEVGGERLSDPLVTRCDLSGDLGHRTPLGREPAFSETPRQTVNSERPLHGRPAGGGRQAQAAPSTWSTSSTRRPRTRAVASGCLRHTACTHRRPAVPARASRARCACTTGVAASWRGRIPEASTCLSR